LQYLIDLLVSAADDIGLRVNAKKTVTMVFSPTDKCKRFCSTFPPFSANGERESFIFQYNNIREKKHNNQLRGGLPERLISPSKMATHCHTHQLRFIDKAKRECRQRSAWVHSARNHVTLYATTGLLR